MNSEELRELLKCEDDRTEWKLSAKDADKILPAICALANDLGDSRRPGYLLIGVDPKTGRVADLGQRGPALDQEQQSLASRLQSSRLWPTPAFDIQLHELDGKTLLVVRVDPYPVPPIVTVDGMPWVRRAATTVRATPADQDRLRERRPLKTQPFDVRPLAGATVEDLDMPALEERYEAAREDVDDPDVFPSFEAWLTQVQLGAPLQGTWTPNPTAILVFGRSPQSFFPGAKVELVRYAGEDIDGPIAFRRTATGTLPQQLDVLWAQMSAHVTEIPAPADGIRAPFVPDYPLEALKEMARNIVQHRQYEGTNAPARIEWFEDRIELSNPGGPFGRASEGEFGSNSDYRNPMVTDWLKQLGYVEQLGRGIRRVRKHLAKNGNPEIEVEVDGFTRVIVRRRV
ncbi:transcriptional regulator [Sorangium cellulosum]|uniref:Transcriptional regulator n=1 Tax=Sorangium cellulosum TaxID=56 RepID=A0A2L0EPM4_SORCE|nr:ATP-binding protein [Sorangium cellulosum]AUX41249.1 transcriptional regulator [Sorangium cellulosum]